MKKSKLSLRKKWSLIFNALLRKKTKPGAPTEPSVTRTAPKEEPAGAHNFLSEGEKAQLRKLLSLSAIRTKKDFHTLSQLSARWQEAEQDAGQQWNDRDTAEVLAMLSQYESLRQESLNTINNRTQIIFLGIASIGAVFGGALTIENPGNNRFLISAIFSFVIPFICAFILLIWAGEAMRCHRVAYFIASELEARINAKFRRLVLFWESFLWSGLLPRDEMFGPSMLSMALLGILSVLSPVFGFIYSGAPWLPLTQPLLTIGLPWFFLLLVVLYMVLNLKRLKNNPIIASAAARGGEKGEERRDGQ